MYVSHQNPNAPPPSGQLPTQAALAAAAATARIQAMDAVAGALTGSAAAALPGLGILSFECLNTISCGF